MHFAGLPYTRTVTDELDLRSCVSALDRCEAVVAPGLALDVPESGSDSETARMEDLAFTFRSQIRQGTVPPDTGSLLSS